LIYIFNEKFFVFPCLKSRQRKVESVKKCGKEVGLLETIKMTNSLIVDSLEKNPRLALECQAEELNDIDTGCDLFLALGFIISWNSV